MPGRPSCVVGARLALALSGWALVASQEKTTPKPRDPVAEAQATRTVPVERPEQRLTDHDRSPQFDPTKPAPLTPALKSQPKEGRITGFDFARDPLNADKPFTTLAEVMKKESAAKAQVT